MITTKRAITFGAFDLLHHGHLRLLARLAEMAQEIYVGLASDEIVTLKKGMPPSQDYNLRRELLLNTPYVDTVLNHDGPVDSSGPVAMVAQKIAFIEQHEIKLVVMGSDWIGAYDFLEPYCDVRYLDRTPGISTTQIRTALLDQATISTNDNVNDKI